LARGEPLKVLEPAVATIVFQVFWGSLFVKLLGDVFGALRLSTFVLVLLSGWAFYAMLLNIGIRRSAAALGAALYFFNPLTYVLTFTFMTDAHYMAMLVIATFLLVRSVAQNEINPRWLAAGSAAAGLAFLIRQQGLLVPLGVLTYLVLSRRLKVERRTVGLILSAAGPSAAIALAYFLWLRIGEGAPEGQRLFTEAVIAAGFGETVQLVWRVGFMTLIYLGLVLIPIVLFGLVEAVRPTRLKLWSVVGVFATVALLCVGLITFSIEGIDFPYAESWLNPTGLGPADLEASRAWVLHAPALRWFPWVGASASLLGVLAFLKAAQRSRSPEIGMLLAVGATQAVGLLLPAFHFNRIWDRYLLPLFPFAIALLLWALIRSRPLHILGWVSAVVFMVVAVAGTRDFLVFESEIWAMARRAVAAGVPLTKLDAGAAWDGYYLWELSHPERNWKPPDNYSHPWWIHFWDLRTDSTYIVSAQPQNDYDFDVIERVSYSQWLDTRRAELFLLRRRGPLPAP
jgi:4-amino-4-deoxy-L-arabinose transferase-like glycosyltransferase